MLLLLLGGAVRPLPGAGVLGGFLRGTVGRGFGGCRFTGRVVRRRSTGLDHLHADIVPAGGDISQEPAVAVAVVGAGVGVQGDVLVPDESVQGGAGGCAAALFGVAVVRELGGVDASLGCSELSVRTRIVSPSMTAVTCAACADCADVVAVVVRCWLVSAWSAEPLPLAVHPVSSSPAVSSAAALVRDRCRVRYSTVITVPSWWRSGR